MGLDGRQKYNIFVDRHFHNLANELGKLKYNVVVVPEFEKFPKKERDKKTHQWLIKNKAEIFITRNGEHFIKDVNRDWKYLMFFVTINADDTTLAKILQPFIMFYRTRLMRMESPTIYVNEITISGLERKKQEAKRRAKARR